jgi:hypothetical protein
MDTFLAVIVGLGLAAACGFRVFVPLLVVSIAAMSGHLQLNPAFAWIGSPFALIMFATATGLEIAGFYVPWLDNLLDTIALPASATAGAVVSAAYISGISPELSWALALIAGAGVAGTVQLVTTGARAVSTALTGGLGNPIVATAELGTSLALSILSMIWPLLAALLLAGVLALVIWGVARMRKPALQPATV